MIVAPHTSSLFPTFQRKSFSSPNIFGATYISWKGHKHFGRILAQFCLKDHREILMNFGKISHDTPK